jgi:hypothetical protein
MNQEPLANPSPIPITQKYSFTAKRVKLKSALNLVFGNSSLCLPEVKFSIHYNKIKLTLSPPCTKFVLQAINNVKKSLR